MSEFSPFGLDLFGEPIEQTGRGPLADAFVMPPFSVFDARSGEWQDRKRCPEAPVEWAAGDALALFPEGAPPRWADFIFTCPPYGDLERYSDDPRDLSTMDYPRFMEAWARALEVCAFRLKPNRFVGVVIGDFRDDRYEFYRGFVADTVRAARAAELKLYNDAILLTPVGSLCLRAPTQFPPSRKLGKTHQNVLVFAKGSPSWMK